MSSRHGPPPDQTDGVFLYNANPDSCGSGGCYLGVFLESPDGGLHKAFPVQSGSGVDDPGVTLDSSYTNGMRNLRFNNAVTWISDGKTYVMK